MELNREKVNEIKEENSISDIKHEVAHQEAALAEKNAEDREERKAILDDAFNTLQEALVKEDVNAVELMAKTLAAHSDLTMQLAERDKVMQEAIKMITTASTSIEDFKTIGHSLILKLQEYEIEMLKEALNERAGNGIEIVKDTIELPKKDAEGNYIPGAHFKGELMWANTEESGIAVYKVAPDALTGTSFAKLPILYLDVAAAVIAFTEDEINTPFRFISERGDKHGQISRNSEVIDTISTKNMDTLEEQLNKKIQFKEKHKAKIEKIAALIKGMKDIRLYDLIGLNIEESVMFVHNPKEPNKPAQNKFTKITGIFRREGELQVVEAEGIKPGTNGSIIQEEWILDESQNEKSKTKFTTRSITSDNSFVAQENEVVNLIFALTSLVRKDREVLMERYKKGQESK